MNLQEKRAEEGYFRTPFCTPKPSEEQEMKSPRRFVEVGMYCKSAGIMMEDAKDGCEKYTVERKVFSRHTLELKLGFSPPALCLSAPFTHLTALHICAYLKQKQNCVHKNNHMLTQNSIEEDR
jgi:hypothetical protein